MLEAFKTPGVIAGLFALAAAISVAFGKPALAAFFSDPATATAITTVVAGVAGLVAGLLRGIKG